MVTDIFYHVSFVYDNRYDYVIILPNVIHLDEGIQIYIKKYQVITLSASVYMLHL